MLGCYLDIEKVWILVRCGTVADSFRGRPFDSYWGQEDVLGLECFHPEYDPVF